MACGKLHVQSCNFVWFLSTVFVVSIAQPKRSGIKRTTQALFNLVVQRPRIAGGTLTIALDSTVQLMKAVGKDRQYNIIRLQYGSKAKHLVMRAPSSHVREQWLVAIAAALPTSPPLETNLQGSSFISPSKFKGGAKKPQSNQYPTRVPQPPNPATFKSTVPSTVAPSNATLSLDDIKSLTQAYENLAQQWVQAATETRQFHSEIANLQPPNRAPVPCVAC